MSLDPAEVAWLAAHPEAIAEAAARELDDATLIADLAALRARHGDRARALVELVRARRGAAGRLPGHWLMSAEAAQQATHALVAAERAGRIARAAGGAWVHDLTCSIGADLAALAAAGARVLGSDLDPARAAMARANVPGAPVLVADALAPASRAPIIVADPARRAGGRRLRRPEQLRPPLPGLLAAWPGAEAAVKCAPGLDFAEWPGEVALASVDGRVKEACLYTPGLAAPGVRRSATLLSTRGAPTRRYHDAMPDGCGAGPAGRFIIDPDGAVVRAGLVRQFAAAHGLHQLDERIAHLTGDAVPPGATGFEVLAEVAPKRLRAELAARDCGSAEVLVRGVDQDPDRLRASWRLRGHRPLAVVLTRVGRSARAFICGPRVAG